MVRVSARAGVGDEDGMRACLAMCYIGRLVQLPGGSEHGKDRLGTTKPSTSEPARILTTLLTSTEDASDSILCN
eukprot:1365176-Pleurochrysis_carterae.AAC.2